MIWQTTAPDLLGFIPGFLDERNPASAREQLNHNYAHGGGWTPFPGFFFNPAAATISYPGDPPLKPVGRAKLRDETIIVYPHAWVLILQNDGTYEVCRMD